MDEQEFEILKQEVDQALNSDASGNLGIAMGFKLAGEFLVRGLFETVRFKLLVDWETRTYQDRYVYPDPMMGDLDFRLGRP